MIESLFNEIDRISREFNLSGLVNVSEINQGKVNHTCRTDFLIDCDYIKHDCTQRHRS